MGTWCSSDDAPEREMRKRSMPHSRLLCIPPTEVNWISSPQLFVCFEDPSGNHAYVTRSGPNGFFGLPARPEVGSAPTPGRAGRPTMLLAAAMVGWLLLTFILAASVRSCSSQGAQVPASVGGGVAISPARGWTQTTDPGMLRTSGVAYYRGGASVEFAGGGYRSQAQDLLDTKLNELGAQLSSLSELTTTPITTQHGVQVLSVRFSGTNQGGQVEGRLYAAVARGTGFLALVLAPVGQLRVVQGDVDQMIRSVVIP